MRSVILVVLTGSLGSLTGFLAKEHTWPSEPGGGGSSVPGVFPPGLDPASTDATAARVKEKSTSAVVPGVYLVVYKLKKQLVLDTFAVPEGTVGKYGEAVLRPPKATMTQEWVILPVPNVDEEYVIENRATGERLQPPAALGVEVRSGPTRGGWTITGSAELGFHLASKASGYVLSAMAQPDPGFATLKMPPKGEYAEGEWELDLIHSLPPNADSTLGYMGMPPAGVEMIPEGVYTITDKATGAGLCAFTDPSEGLGDYEAHLSTSCAQEWLVIAGKPEPGNPDAAAAPPPIFELRESASGAVLDAYMMGTFGAHLRSDAHTISQRWMFVKLGDDYEIVHASDQRNLGVTNAVSVTTGPKQHAWALTFLRGLPALPASTACKTVCDGGATCGQQDDNCGGVIQCGECDVLDTCQDNVCVCIPFPCEENMCGSVPSGCGDNQDCGGCGDGLSCDEATHSCSSAPVLPPIPNVSNASLLPTTPAPVANDTAPTPCPACDSCCPTADGTGNVTDANATDNATNATNATDASNETNATPVEPPPPTQPPDDDALLRQLAPGILAKLSGVFADAAADSLHDYPVNLTDARAAALKALTVDEIVGAAHTVNLSAPVLDYIHAKAHNQAEVVFNRTMAERVVDIDVMPVFMKNISVVENVTHAMVIAADPPSFRNATSVAGTNGSIVATDAAMHFLEEYKSTVAKAAFASVKNTTIRIASDVAVNSLMYNVEEGIRKKVTFDPADVMARAHVKLINVGTVQAIADKISSLMSVRAVNRTTTVTDTVDVADPTVA
jgi:hypothetical protein